MRLFLSLLVSLFAMLSLSLWGQKSDSIRREHRLQRYAFQIETPKSAISGILLSSVDDEKINGSMVNEFGVSAIDFTYKRDKDKIQLLSVVSFLDKWYIRWVLKRDLRFCLHVLFATPYKSKHSYEVTHLADSIFVVNPKRHIKYTFAPLTHSPNEHDIEE